MSKTAYNISLKGYVGGYDFDSDIIDECYDLERTMGNLANYFDFEAFGRELFMWDYSMGPNGNVFRRS